MEDYLKIRVNNLSPVVKKNIDYETIVFHFEYPKKINVETASDASIFLKTLINGGAKKIIIDLKEVEIIDSAGISTIVQCTKLIRNNNGDITLINVNESIYSILEMVKLGSFIKIFNNEVEAVNFFRYLNI